MKRLASLSKQRVHLAAGGPYLLDCCLNGTDGKQRGFPHLPKLSAPSAMSEDLFVAERFPLGVCGRWYPMVKNSFCNRHEPFQSVDENRNRFEFFAAQVGAAQVGAAQVGVAQVGVAQVGVAQVGVAQVGAAQVGAARSAPRRLA